MNALVEQKNIFNGMTKDKTEKRDSTELIDSQINDTERAEVEFDDSGKDIEPQQKQDEEETSPTERLQKELDESKDRYVRLSAEFDNYRKRTQREKMDLIRYGSEDVMKAMLPLIDDVERAIKHMDDVKDVNALKEGVELIHLKFKEFLKTNGVQEIEALGLELDTDVHEAVTKIPAPDKKLKGKIVDVIEKGYKLNEKVIRFSKVVIGE